jgi:hypothetical protein
VVETLGDPVHHRLFQPVVMQHGRVDEGGEFRLPADDILRLGPHAIPDWIERRQLAAALRIDLMLHHNTAP